jgi:hypothetical protein
MSGYEEMIPAVIQVAVSAADASAQQNAAEESAKAQQDARARQTQLLLQRQAAEEQQQMDQLARASATQRARVAATGYGGTSGSADAILEGLNADANAAVASTGQTTQIKLQQINGGAGSNLLDNAANTRTGLSVFRSFYDALG